MKYKPVPTLSERVGILVYGAYNTLWYVFIPEEYTFVLGYFYPLGVFVFVGPWVRVLSLNGLFGAETTQALRETPKRKGGGGGRRPSV